MKTCVWVVVLDDDDNGGGGDWVEKHYQFNSQIHDTFWNMWFFINVCVFSLTSSWNLD